jgi:hypothetical protein
MKARQISYGTHVYRGIGHNFDIPTWDDASRRAATFFNKFLKAPKTKLAARKGTPSTATAATASRRRAAAPTKAGSGRPKTVDGDGGTEADLAKPSAGDAPPNSAKPQPIIVDAQPTPKDAPAKASTPQPTAGEPPVKSGQLKGDLRPAPGPGNKANDGGS